MGTLSKVFGSKHPLIPHIGGKPNTELWDLRKDVEEAFLELEQGGPTSITPTVYGIHTNKAQKGGVAIPAYVHTSASADVVTFHNLINSAVRVALVNETLGVVMPYGRVVVDGQDVYIYPKCNAANTMPLGATIPALITDGSPHSAWAQVDDGVITANTPFLVSAQVPGEVGNGLVVTLTYTASPNLPLTVSWTPATRTVAVRLATNGANAITSTAAQVITAINAGRAYAAQATLTSGAGAAAVVFTARDPGIAGNLINVTINTPGAVANVPFSSTLTEVVSTGVKSLVVNLATDSANLLAMTSTQVATALMNPSSGAVIVGSHAANEAILYRSKVNFPVTITHAAAGAHAVTCTPGVTGVVILFTPAVASDSTAAVAFLNSNAVFSKYCVAEVVGTGAVTPLVSVGPFYIGAGGSTPFRTPELMTVAAGGAGTGLVQNAVVTYLAGGLDGHDADQFVVAGLQSGSTAAGVFACGAGTITRTLAKGADAHNASAIITAVDTVGGVVDALAIGVGLLPASVVASGLMGVANDATTKIDMIGTGFEGDRDRDRYTHIDAAANASFDIYAMDLGDTGLKVTIAASLGAATATWTALTKTIAITMAAGVRAANDLRAICNDPLNAQYLAAIDARICITPRGTGAGTITLGSGLSYDLVGGGASKILVDDISAPLGANQTFWVVANTSGRTEVQFTIVDDVAHAARFVDINQGAGIVTCHVEVGVTTCLELQTMVHADADAHDLITIWQVGNGSGVVSALMNAVEGVVTMTGGDIPDTTDLAPVISVGGVLSAHLGSSYTTITQHPSNTLLCTSLTGFADLTTAGFTALDVLDTMVTIDGVPSRPIMMTVVDSI
jgi:hypothetical protein